MTTIFRFRVGETVFIHHITLLYKAKVMKREQREKQNFYFVCYPGWQGWDEWVEECRLWEEISGSTRMNATRQAFAKHLPRKRKAPAPPPLPPDSTLLVAINSIRDDVPKEWKDVLPRTLLSRISEQEDKKFAYPLPCSPNAEEVVFRYCSANHHHPLAHVLDATAKGLLSYFDKAMGTLLLFPFERSQFLELGEEVWEKPSVVYGAPQLIRLFLVVGSNVSGEGLPDVDHDLLRALLHHFARWIDNNWESLDSDRTKTNQYRPRVKAEVSATKGKGKAGKRRRGAGGESDEEEAELLL